jgi:hypothetical protein
MTPINISMYICSPFHHLSHQQSSSSSTATRGYLRKVLGAACLPLKRLTGRRELFSNSVVFDQCNRIPDWEKMEGSMKWKPGQWANPHSCNGVGEEGSGHNREGWREMDFKQRPLYITLHNMQQYEWPFVLEYH